jgi:hypothetical protein
MAPMGNPNYKHVGAEVAEGDGLVYYVLHAAYPSDGKHTNPIKPQDLARPPQ